jgi:hypothetical protein
VAITRIGNIASTIPDNSIQNVKMSNIVQSKNIIINGGMDIAQRGTSTSSITSSSFVLDRWNIIPISLGTWTNSQSTDVPTGQGFASSFKVDCTTADASPAAGDLLIVRQKFEGQNLQYLSKGTSSAKSTTLSFWVKSNKTGTYIAELFDNDNSRTISKSYTINSANTWEKKSVTFAGDTTGTLDNDNALSLIVSFWLGAGTTFTSGTLQTDWGSLTSANRAVGQVNLADSTDNEWYVTGIQLEAGSVASDFEFLPVDCNLQRCQRYFQAFTSSDRMYALQYSSAYRALVFSYVCTMRASPTQSFTAVGGSTTASSATVNSIFRYINLAYTSGTATYIHSLTLDAEL